MYCILVAGMPASGKSTLALKISGELNIPVLSKDSIKELMFDDIGFHSRDEKVRLGNAAMHIMYYAAEQMMKCSMPFVLENNFEDASMPGIMELLTGYRYQGITVLLTGNPAVIYERFRNRNASDDRHPGHVYDDMYPRPACEEHTVPVQKSREQFMSDVQIRGYNRFRANGPCIEVNVDDFGRLNYTAVLSAIRDAVNAHENGGLSLLT